MDRFHCFEKRSFSFKNDEEKTKRLFWKTIFFEKVSRFVNESRSFFILKIVNDDPLLTKCKEKKYLICGKPEKKE